jgi:hypothetical protein
MYINFVKSYAVKSYALSSRLYVLGFSNVCCNFGASISNQGLAFMISNHAFAEDAVFADEVGISLRYKTATANS